MEDKSREEVLPKKCHTVLLEGGPQSLENTPNLKVRPRVHHWNNTNKE
jgi:hypothetical protein